MATGARARARAEITAEITAAARRQVAAEGPSALSLRAIARELGMVSSALYRYFPSRDDLLTALIIDAYDAVGAAAEAAVTDRRGGFPRRWRRLGAAVRDWARANPHDYALVYGSPVPGYRAPQATVAPAARVTLAALGVVVDGIAAGEVDPAGPALPAAVRRDLEALVPLGSGVTPAVLARALGAWAGLLGTISLELFGHLHGVIVDYDAFFDDEVRRFGALVAGGR